MTVWWSTVSLCPWQQWKYCLFLFLLQCCKSWLWVATHMWHFQRSSAVISQPVLQRECSFLYIWMYKHRTISQSHLPKTGSAAGKQNQTQGSSLNAELLYCWFSQGHQQEPRASKVFGCLSVQQNTSSVVIVFQLCTNHAGTHANPWRWSLESVSRLDWFPCS